MIYEGDILTVTASTFSEQVSVDYPIEKVGKTDWRGAASYELIVEKLKT